MILIRAIGAKPWRSHATYRLIERSLMKKWRAVHVIRPADERDLLRQLSRHGGEPGRQFVFNIAEFIDEKRKRGFLPALLERWGYPHLGSPASAVLAGLDKERTKEILRQRGIPTPRSFVTRPDDPEIREKASELGFPLFVKPLGEGGHIGVSRDSIVRDLSALERAVLRLSMAHHQPALVEEFIGGREMREFSVGIVGSTNRFHFPIEIDWNAMASEERILTADLARNDGEKVKPVTDTETRTILRELADRTFDAMGASDYARIDIRANGDAMFVLEINIMPGIGPHSFLPQAARQMLGIRHEDLVRRIAAESMARQGVTEEVP